MRQNGSIIVPGEAQAFLEERGYHRYGYHTIQRAVLFQHSLRGMELNASVNVWWYGSAGVEMELLINRADGLAMTVKVYPLTAETLMERYEVLAKQLLNLAEQLAEKYT